MTIDRLGQDAALLEAAVRDRLRPDDPSLRDLLARRPEWGEILVQASAGQLPPGLLAELQAAERSDDRRWTDELLAETRAGTPAPARPRAARSPWLAAAAAVLCVAAGVALGRRWTASPAPEPFQGLGDERGSAASEELTLIAPLGRVERIDTFQWKAERELLADESWLVILSRANPDGSRGEELRRVPTHESSWQPDAFDLADLPLRLHWSVQRVSASGAFGPRSEAWVERSSP